MPKQPKWPNICMKNGTPKINLAHYFNNNMKILWNRRLKTLEGKGKYQGK